MSVSNNAQPAPAMIVPSWATPVVGGTAIGVTLTGLAMALNANESPKAKRQLISEWQLLRPQDVAAGASLDDVSTAWTGKVAGLVGLDTASGEATRHVFVDEVHPVAVATEHDARALAQTFRPDKGSIAIKHAVDGVEQFVPASVDTSAAIAGLDGDAKFAPATAGASTLRPAGWHDDLELGRIRLDYKYFTDGRTEITPLVPTRSNPALESTMDDVVRGLSSDLRAGTRFGLAGIGVTALGLAALGGIGVATLSGRVTTS